MMRAPLDPTLAHQGGWDEIALFAIPVLVALAAVRLVERRHRRKPSSGDGGPDDAGEQGEDV
jgi:hypothetical protein